MIIDPHLNQLLTADESRDKASVIRTRGLPSSGTIVGRANFADRGG